MTSGATALEKNLGTISHHAYVLSGDAGRREALLAILEKKHGITTHGNPDFFNVYYDTFTIDDARQLKAHADTRPVRDGGRKYFIIHTSAITVEAQNALLKLLEEPPAYAVFFMVVPSLHLLLPTVQSRLAVIEGVSSTKADGDDDMRAMVNSFIKASPKDRLEMIKSLIDDIGKEKRTKQDAIDFLNAMQAVLRTELGAAGLSKNLSKFNALELARKYMTDRAPSLKMLLEYAALTI